MGTAVDRYREGCRKGELRLFRCSSCGALEAFARDFCPRCGAPDPVSVSAGGRGVVAAITVAHIAPSPEYRALVPYGICLIDLDEGVRVMGNCAPGLAVGDRVALSFAERGDAHLLQFTSTGDEDR
ncbi:Zn-ribbon domain-containing OB-fold protein [Saliniramus sp.]|uniref:Zn-ribbon domain-containing OB-fold protein n=1 Tax=Saliniramus sp. TaxID=2986772 RepID=UPI002C698BCD|nr:OB-fold domain-containing protein [Saliniramus sp.]HMB09043.1 OB-fold domain-containing protein [Saliniramus sp.]